MNLFGIGFWELVFVVLIMLIVLGPEETVRLARIAGRGLRRLLDSPYMQMGMRLKAETEERMREIMREAGLEEAQQRIYEIEQAVRQSQQMLHQAAQEAARPLTEAKPRKASEDGGPERAQEPGPPRTARASSMPATPLHDEMPEKEQPTSAQDRKL